MNQMSKNTIVQNGGDHLIVSRKRLVFTVVALLLLVVQMGFAQKRWKEYLVTGSSMMVSGMLDGTIESMSYHYENGFQRRFPKLNNQFWNPAVSWTNKYKNHNPAEGPKFMGSTNMFAWTTDGYHLLRTTKRVVDMSTLTYYINRECVERESKYSRKKRVKKMAVDFVVLTAIRCVGFNLTYSVMFKPVNNNK